MVVKSNLKSVLGGLSRNLSLDSLLNFLKVYYWREVGVVVVDFKEVFFRKMNLEVE